MKKKLVNIEKCADFTTKYGHAIQYINDDFLSNETNVSTVVTLPQSSQTRTLYIYNKSLCIVKQDPSTKLLYVDAVLFSDISRIEQTTPEFIIVKSDGERYVLPISDEKFINALELAICKCIRSHYSPLIPHNIEMDLNVARAAAQEELSSMSTGERKTMMLEFFRLSGFMNSKIASETLLRSSGGFDLTNKLIADPETLEYVFSNVHFNI